MPLFGALAYCFNVYKCLGAGEACHTGLLNASQQLADAAGYKLNLQTAITPLDKAVFNHFIVAKPSFWDEWRRVVAIYFNTISRGESLKFKMVRYKNSALPIHTFVLSVSQR